MNKVLCIDLDGTLIFNDTTIQVIGIFIKKNPLHVFLVLAWLLRGRAYLKQQLGKRIIIDVTKLPYNQELLTWIKTEKQQGRKIVLVTATDQKFANAVAEHINIFDEVLASDGKVNLRAQYKAAALNRHYGEKNYDYAGNSVDDLAVWKYVDKAIVVNAPATLLTRAKMIANVSHVFSIK